MSGEVKPFEIDPEVEEWLDRSNPKSIYNMVPESVQIGMEAVTKEMLYMTAEEMEEAWPITDSTIQSITSTIKKIRYSFWEEFHRSHNLNQSIKILKVVTGVCSRSYFRDKVATVPHRLAYILKAPDNYKYSLMELHEVGLRQMMEILTAPNYTVDKYGNQIFDSKLARVKVEILKTSQDRLFGGAVHRSLQVTENFNRDLTNQSPNQGVAELPDVSQMDPEKLEQFIDRLRGVRAGFTTGEEESELIEVEGRNE